MTCQGCSREIEAYGWECIRCRRVFCPYCVEPLQAITHPIRCRPCAADDRAAEVNARLARLGKR